MTPLEFLSLVWPSGPDNIYCLAHPSKGKGYVHKIFTDITQAADYIERVKDRENIFYTTHTLLEPQVWNAKHHKKPGTSEWVEAWSVRLQRNMKSCREFFFDLDVEAGVKEKYQDQMEALTHLKEFVTKFKLPRPMVVNSGGGLHIHWLVDKFLPSNTVWHTNAARLKQLGVKFGLKLDPMRTTDTSSVLRVPGTFNMKKDLKRPVQDWTKPDIVAVEDWEQRVLAGLGSVGTTPVAGKTEPDELGSNVGPKTYTNLVPPSAESVYEACPQMARLRDLNGCMGHNSWWAGMGVLRFTIEGLKACHEFSKGYPGYSFDEVEQKAGEWKYGPTSCAKLASVVEPQHQHICQGCPHVGKHQGPLSFGKFLEKAPSPVVQDVVDGVEVDRVVPDPPLPYKRTKDLSIVILSEAPDGKQSEIPLHPYDLYPIDRQSNEKGETETQVWRAHLPHGIVRDFTIEASAFVDPRALQARLANVGIYTSQFSNLSKYMSAYIQELQRRQRASSEHNHLGWINDRTEFVLPSGLIKEDGSTVPVSLGGNAAKANSFMDKKGTMKRQIELLNFYADKRYVAQQFMICCSLASPIFFATGQAGVIVNLTGKPGSSKSTTLYTAASLWGHPTRYVLSGLNDGATPLFRTNRMHMLANLPFCIDEITRLTADVAKDAAFGSTQEMPRKGMNTKGQERKVEENAKSNIVLSTGNVSMHHLTSIDNNAGTAASVRVFEIVVRQLGIHLGSEADAMLRELKENYGHIGEYFMKGVVPNRKMVAERVIAKMTLLERLATMSPDERFWFSASSSALTGCQLGNKLGVLPYDPAYMQDWLLTDCLPTLRGVVKDEQATMSPVNLLTTFLEDINGNILFNNGIGGNTIRVPNGRLLGQHKEGSTEITVLKDGFREWCQKRHQFSSPILRELLDIGVILKFDTRETLGAGTAYAKSRSTCFVVDLTHPEIMSSPAVQTFIAPNLKPKM